MRAEFERLKNDYLKLSDEQRGYYGFYLLNFFPLEMGSKEQWSNQEITKLLKEGMEHSKTYDSRTVLNKLEEERKREGE